MKAGVCNDRTVRMKTTKNMKRIEMNQYIVVTEVYLRNSERKKTGEYSGQNAWIKTAKIIKMFQMNQSIF